MADVAETETYSSGVTAVVAGTPMTAASVNAGLGKAANRLKWLKLRLYDLLFGSQLTVSAADTSTDRLTVTSHGLGANTAVRIFAANGGTLPGGLSANTVYYVDVVDANTIKLSASSGPGAAVDLTAGFAGDVYVSAIPDWVSSLLVADATYGAGKLKDVVMWIAGAQTITGAKTFDDLTMSGTNYVKYTSRSKSRTLPVTWVDVSTALVYRTPATIPSGKTFQGAIELPHGQTITGLTVSIDPALHGSLPGTMPKVTLVKISGTTTTEIANKVDDSADATIFSAQHEVAITGMSEVIDNETNSYRVDVRGSSDDTVVIYRVKATVTVTSDQRWT